jgi:hypothetical protein
MLLEQIKRGQQIFMRFKEKSVQRGMKMRAEESKLEKLIFVQKD